LAIYPTLPAPTTVPDLTNLSTVLLMDYMRSLAAVLAATLPKTTQSKREFPPNLFFPWTAPMASPAT